MNSDFSRRNFLRNSLLAGAAAGAALQASGPAFAKEVVKAKSTETTPKVINLAANTLSIGPAAPALTAIAQYAPDLWRIRADGHQRTR